MNVLDIIVVVISFIGLISKKFPNISVVRLLRWFHHPNVKISSMDSPLPLVSDTYVLLCKYSSSNMGTIKLVIKMIHILKLIVGYVV